LAAVTLRDLMPIFQSAFDEFLKRERANILNDISERNLCSRLMIYLERAKDTHGLADYFTDTEYNRKQGKVKTIIDSHAHVLVITCDLILHSRGALRSDNLIAIEMKKKHHKKADKDADRERLIVLTMQNNVYPVDQIPEHASGYELGLFIELDVSAAQFLIETYRGGVMVSQTTGAF
jgi:hypothetical protein